MNLPLLKLASGTTAPELRERILFNSVRVTRNFLQNFLRSPRPGGEVFHDIFDEIISLENLFLAWDEFKKGKREKRDVQEFEYNLENNIFELHEELESKTYRHSNYTSFYVCDPKLRKIHKATVKDRVLHHAIFRILYPLFDKSFIFDSYSCRNKKGTHRAVNRLNVFARKVSKNNTRNCFVLKCDVRKFFDSVDQEILTDLLKKKIKDGNAIWLVKGIIKSFPKGLPLGNITSQLFANIYLNELDQFIKHSTPTLRRVGVKNYVRYCDDFIILSNSREYLENIIYEISNFLGGKLKLFLHPNKVVIKKYHQGIDFLGYVDFPYFRILRTKTKKQMIKKLKNKLFLLKRNKLSEKSFCQTIQSYLGVLKHCNGNAIKEKIVKFFDIFAFFLIFLPKRPKVG